MAVKLAVCAIWEALVVAAQPMLALAVNSHATVAAVAIGLNAIA